MSKDLVKQVIVVRRDLKMPVGKVAAQVSHASMAFLTRGLKYQGFIPDDPWSKANWLGSNHSSPEREQPNNIRSILVDTELALWLDGPFTKVVLSVDSEDAIQAIHASAINSGCRTSIIVDEGRTVFNGIPTITCVAVGPNYIDKVDAITGNLPLYK